MKSAILSDLLKLKKRFEAWRKTRAKRSKTPDRLLKAAAALLDQYSASMVCRVCGINLRTLRRRSSSKASTRRSATPAPDFFPLSLTLPQLDVSSSPRQRLPGSPRTTGRRQALHLSPEPYRSINLCPLLQLSPLLIPMIQLVPQLKILLACEPVDFRKGIDSLAALCKGQLDQDPLSGVLFVFRNRAGTALKLLTFDLC